MKGKRAALYAQTGINENDIHRSPHYAASMAATRFKAGPSECIVWEGAPDKRYIVTVFVARYVIWGAVAVASAFSVFYISWWLLILALPVYLFAAWRCEEARATFVKDRSTRYAVTNRRAVITQEKPVKATKTFKPNEIGQVEFRGNHLGVTNVLFNHDYRGAKFGPDAHVKFVSTGFLRIRDRDGAKNALEAISELEPRHRVSPDKMKIIKIWPAITE